MKILKCFRKNEKKIKAFLIFISSVITLLLLFRFIVYGLSFEIFNKIDFLMFKKFLNGFFIMYIIFISIVIFFESKDSSSTLAWLLVLMFLPGLGFVFYILFGRNIGKKFRSIKEKNTGNSLKKAIEMQKEIVDCLPFENSKEETILEKQLIKLLLNNSEAPLSRNNKVMVLENGAKTYHHMIKEIKHARKFIHFQFFIIKNDSIGNEFREILIKKANEGVEVRVIYDSVGCWKLGKKYINSLKNAGVEIHPYSPVLLPILSRDLNYRNHRKIIVVDGQIGFVGGLNIGDEYLGKNKVLGFWRDTHLQINGAGVYSLQRIFIDDWLKVSGEELKEKKYYPDIEKITGDSFMQVVSSGPDSDWQCIMKAYFTMITKANKKIWINTPYLVPESSLRVGLITAALSGVDVRIIIPNKPDHFFVYWSSRDNIEELLKAGVKIYTYERGFIHSKIILVDSIVSTVGTANLDYRSLDINYEVNAFIYDKKVINKLEDNFLRDLKNSRKIVLEEHLKRGYIEKGLESLGRLVSPLQ